MRKSFFLMYIFFPLNFPVSKGILSDLEHEERISVNSTDPSIIQSNSEVPVIAPRKSKGEIQRELLGLKRKAFTLRRQGKSEEAEEPLRNAKILEAQMDMEAPKTELPPHASKDKGPEGFGYLITNEKHGSMEDVVEVNEHSVQAVVDPT